MNTMSSTSTANTVRPPVLKDIAEKSFKERSALLEDPRTMNIFVAHATEPNTSVLLHPANLSRGMVMAFCKAARSAAGQNEWHNSRYLGQRHLSLHGLVQTSLPQ